MGKTLRYLAPTDFSKGCAVALEHAKRFAKDHDAELHVVHVMKHAVYPAGMDMAQTAFVNLEKELSESALSNLDKSKKALEADGFKCETALLRGKPSSELIEYCDNNQIDLIFINTHGAGGLEHMLFGSTTEKVLRKAKCPVYVVRNKD